MIKKRLIEYAKLMRLNRPIGTYLLLWPTLWALWLAGEGKPQQSTVLIFCIGVFLMRSAGCVVNDIADRNFDAHVERTQTRPLAIKSIFVIEAMIILMMLLCASIYIASFLNTYAQLLTIPAAFFALSYPFVKRFHSLPQAHLGIAFSFGIPMSYAALLNAITFEAWLLMLINLIWVIIYDTQYAINDKADDKKIKIKSSALLLEKYCGTRDYLVIFAMQITMLLALFWLGQLRDFGKIWWCCLIVIAGYFIKHTIWINRRLASHQPSNCFAAFLENHTIGGLIFIGIVLSLLPQ